MKTSCFIKITFLFSSVFLLLPGGMLFAQASKSYTWHDGERAHTVWILPDQIADFASSDDGAVSKMDPDAKIKKTSGDIRIWKISNSGVIQSLRSGVMPKLLKGTHSPVFSSDMEGGQLRALPGNIIVSFNPKWSPAAIDAFAKTNNLILLEKMRMLGNVYVVKSEPGLDSLNLANKIRAIPGVVASYPNWWVEMVAR